jgi:hypothetical protein
MGKKNKRVRTDEPVYCIAHSSRTGLPCKKWPMKGQNVCRMHGGAAGAARRRAAERIALASDKAAQHLFAFMNDTAVPHNVRLAAAKDLLDRANVSGKTTVELEVKPWEELLAGIVADVPEGTPMREFVDSESDPLVIEAQRVDMERELAEYAPADRDWSHPAASDSEPPPPPVPATPPPLQRVNGDERLPHVRRRIDGDEDRLPRPYTPTYRPRRRGRPGR